MKKFFTVFFLSFVFLSFADNPPVDYRQEEFSFISFDTLVRENSIVIKWKASQQDKNLIIYRSTRRFSSFLSLSESTPIANIKDTGQIYIDHPVSGIPFYYAIVEENQVGSGKVAFIGGKNTSTIPIEIVENSNTIKNKQEKQASKRPVPLPYLNLKQDTRKRKVYFSSRTENMINALVVGQENYQEFKSSNLKREIFIFPDDRRQARGGETMQLQKILKNNFSTKDWKKAQARFEDFLKIKRTSRVTARTEFYLAESLFFQGKYKEALLKFLSTENVYPDHSKEWTRYCLLELTNEPEENSQ